MRERNQSEQHKNQSAPGRRAVGCWLLVLRARCAASSQKENLTRDTVRDTEHSQEKHLSRAFALRERQDQGALLKLMLLCIVAAIGV